MHLLQTQPRLWVEMARHNSRRRPYLSDLLDITFNRGSNAREMALRVRVYCAFVAAAAEEGTPTVPAPPEEMLEVWRTAFVRHPLLLFVMRRLLECDRDQDDFASESLPAVLRLWLATGAPRRVMPRAAMEEGGMREALRELEAAPLVDPETGEEIEEEEGESHGLLADSEETKTVRASDAVKGEKDAAEGSTALR